MISGDFESRYTLEIKKRNRGNFLTWKEGKLFSIIEEKVEVQKICKDIGCNRFELNALVRDINGEEELIIAKGNSLILTEHGKDYVDYFNKLSNVLSFYSIHPYIRPAITVDGIIFYGKKLVIIRRRNYPFEGSLALPGGYVNYNETVECALLREMEEEIGQKPKEVELFTVVSDPGRDPRGHTISIVYSGKISNPPIAGDDASSILLVEPEDLMKEKMAFDHQEIIRKFIRYRDGQS